MRFFDILTLAAQDLWARKLRTFLNLTGIVTGCTMLLLTALGATGSTAVLRGLFESAEEVRKIWIEPQYFYAPEPPQDAITISDLVEADRVERIRSEMIAAWKGEHREEGLDAISPALLAQLSEIPRVDRVIPDVRVDAQLTLDAEAASSTPLFTHIVSTDVHSSVLAAQLLAGDVLDAAPRDEVLVSEWLAYRLGYLSRDDLKRLIGKQVTLRFQAGGRELHWMYQFLTQQYGTLDQGGLAEQIAFASAFQQVLADLDSTSLSSEQKATMRNVTQSLMTSEAESDDTVQVFERSFRIRGVIHTDEAAASPSKMFQTWFGQSSGDVFVHHALASELHTQTSPNADIHNATVVVHSAGDLASVTSAIEKLKLQAFSAEYLWETIHYQIERATSIVYGLAAAVLLTAALGISNTLLISVLQRTPEMGILKSVGARDRDILLLMLAEGTLLGVIGAAVSIGIGWLLSWVGTHFLSLYISSRAGETVTGQLFQFTWWPVLLVCACSIFICVLASTIPAWRAARIDPVIAMRRR
ncbi:MAG: ABC transporter permease [Pirellulaceae bacterium]